MSEFNQQKYQNEWNKKNLAYVRGQYKKEFVQEFKEACNKLDLKQSQVIRQAMEEVIKKASHIDD